MHILIFLKRLFGTTAGYCHLRNYSDFAAATNFLMHLDTTLDAVLQSIRKAKPKHLESVELFDIYRGEGVHAGHKSVAYAFYYRSKEGTLKDKQVDAVHEKVIEQLRNDLNATIRG